MSYNTPAETAAIAVESGVAKAGMSVGPVLVGSFLAGAYIAFASLLAIVASAGMPSPTQDWAGVTTIVTGVVFSVGLVLVVVGGSELLTGNMMYLPIALLARRIGAARLVKNWVLVTIGNLIGSLFVAYVLAYATGVIGGADTKAHIRLVGIVTGKAITETHLEVFLRGLGCNWLVCMGVWLALAATSVSGKILGILGPISAFVALGFDHVVANMFFLPLGLMEHVPHLTLGDVVWNLVMAFCGNLIGAGVFVAGAYWYIYLRPRTEREAVRRA
ncbi:formate/nitrite transporter family protein [Tsukamurella soli]|uniref:Formate/nitrite transporter family protein n=1 Tax=Tsukamurella soli TaxID=644556 RepID=A0ABP8JVV8_9ACTN